MFFIFSVVTFSAKLRLLHYVPNDKTFEYVYQEITT